MRIHFTPIIRILQAGGNTANTEGQAVCCPNKTLTILTHSKLGQNVTKVRDGILCNEGCGQNDESTELARA